MEKLIYLFRDQETASRSEFKERLLSGLKLAAEAGASGGLKLVVTDRKPPRISVIPFKRQLTATVSSWDPGPEVDRAIRSIRGLCGVYRVEEATPVAYTKDWPDGEPTPGACLLTLFRQKTSIDYETFIDRWHNSHTPLSLKLHPLWNYSRNVVAECLTEDSPAWDGIVEEQVRERADLLNPFRFFGNPLVILPNMIRVWLDTKSFLDYGTIEPYLATEYYIKGP